MLLLYSPSLFFVIKSCYSLLLLPRSPTLGYYQANLYVFLVIQHTFWDFKLLRGTRWPWDSCCDTQTRPFRVYAQNDTSHCAAKIANTTAIRITFASLSIMYIAIASIIQSTTFSAYSYSTILEAISFIYPFLVISWSSVIFIMRTLTPS